jgi:alpha-beta hydrolase superfamily lysophospholipase
MLQANIATWQSFARVVHAVDPSVAVLAFSGRGSFGSGGADPADSPDYTFAQFAADLLGLVDAVWDKPGASFHFAGHSLGVIVGLQLLMHTAPARLLSMMLVAGAPMGTRTAAAQCCDFRAKWLNFNRNRTESPVVLLEVCPF